MPSRVICIFSLVCGWALCGRPVIAQTPSSDALRKQPEAIQSLFHTRRHEAIRLLGAERSESARALLLEVALGQHGSLSRGWAATSYLNSLDDKREAVRLLDTDHSLVLNRALLALHGQPLDDVLLRKLERFLQSDELAVRRDALGVMRYATASGEPAAAMAATMILNSIESCARLPHTENVAFGSGIGWIQNFSQLDAFVVAALGALASSEAITLPALVRAEPPTSGLSREAVIVARGIRGDATVLPEYRRLMEHSARPGVRLVAVEGFRMRATTEDLELLERIRLHDPFVVALTEQERQAGPAPHLGVGDREGYPIRFAASSVVRFLQPSRWDDDRQGTRPGSQ